MFNSIMCIPTATSDRLLRAEKTQNVEGLPRVTLMWLWGRTAHLPRELQTDRICLEFKSGCPRCGPTRRQPEEALPAGDTQVCPLGPGPGGSAGECEELEEPKRGEEAAHSPPTQAWGLENNS